MPFTTRAVAAESCRAGTSYANDDGGGEDDDDDDGAEDEYEDLDFDFDDDFDVVGGDCAVRNDGADSRRAWAVDKIWSECDESMSDATKRSEEALRLRRTGTLRFAMMRSR